MPMDTQEFRHAPEVESHEANEVAISASFSRFESLCVDTLIEHATNVNLSVTKDPSQVPTHQNNSYRVDKELPLKIEYEDDSYFSITILARSLYNNDPRLRLYAHDGVTKQNQHSEYAIDWIEQVVLVSDGERRGHVIDAAELERLTALVRMADPIGLGTVTRLS